MLWLMKNNNSFGNICFSHGNTFWQTSTSAPLKLWNAFNWVISPHTLLDMWLIIHAVIDVNQGLEKGVAVILQTSLEPVPRFNIKMSSYRYRKSHCGDKTILRPSYLHNGIFYTGETTSLYWVGVQARKGFWYTWYPSVILGFAVSNTNILYICLCVCLSIRPSFHLSIDLYLHLSYVCIWSIHHPYINPYPPILNWHGYLLEQISTWRACVLYIDYTLNNL